ncbi:hypothetical protein [Niallia nealsonii]|uniref:Sucrose phosphatase-like domain-containing protein n=1 Tax=Niallia nealsonii TaxID=115979 RepID=A0A2N0Z3E1_9BACI|nr:hypothetical protein [Niallia nealsonii]PKG24037.1 hypothetical protein CWS01_08170 [Niallia nealsonii]
MKMFASDLDRTLIYSQRALETLQTPLTEKMRPVEKRNNEDVSFMTKDSFFLLQEIAKECLFVPVTTRTYEQYKRVFIFGKEIPVDYSVTNNGSHIYYRGELIKEWKTKVLFRLEEECIKKELLLEQLEKFNVKGTLKIADDLFFYYILNQELSTDEKNRMTEMAKAVGWKVSLQGKKLYFMPLPICKGEAIKYIQKREGITTVFGAGDSILDAPFLAVCDSPFIPRHGEIALQWKNGNSHDDFTKSSGAYAGEEIIQKVHKLLASIGSKER